MLPSDLVPPAIDPPAAATATPAPRVARPVVDRVGGFASYGNGEICEMVGCSTLLSRYNSARVCAAHDPRKAR